MTELLELLKRLEQERFYGSLEVKLEAGRVTLLRRTETINPRTRDSKIYRENRGEKHEYSGK